MKKLVLILLALTLVLCLVGCDIPSESDSESDGESDGERVQTNRYQSKNIFIWTDEETGVQYIVYSDKDGYGGMGGITPRLNADGTLYTEGEK